MYYLLLFHDNNGYANASHCYVCTLPASLRSVCTAVLETVLDVLLVSLEHADTVQTQTIMSEILPRAFYY
jgi:hypothetical protein